MAEPQHVKKRRRGQPSLYDAVAGRVTKDGFLQGSRSATTRDANTQPQTIVPPEEALYRRKGAPVRYEEEDAYFHNRHLTAEQSLPESDLLKIIHAYAADFYSRTSEDGGKVDQKSLDETALIAIGILLEEAAAKVVGKTGHLALLDESE